MIPLLSFVAIGTASGATRLGYSSTLDLSTQTGPEHAANKGKIARLQDGTLVVVYGDAAGPLESAWNYDGELYAARDIFMTYSKDDGASWSTPLNISNTANLTDSGVFFDPDGNGDDGLGGLAPKNYYGDSDKPNLYAPALKNNLIVTWTDKYCGAGAHGPAVYTAPYLSLDPGEIEVPFSCVYAARLINSGSGVSLLLTEQVSDGSRDAKSDVARGTGTGLAIAWQEDPEGLQPGEAEGPGEGGSGAKVSHGTDIWYTWITTADFTGGNAWATPVRISDNDGGSSGSSRPNIFMGGVSGSSPYTIIAYEETKGLGIIEGKYVIYHVFPYNTPDVASGGTIISDPTENARRVRFVAQGEPGATYGTRLFIFWRQGVEDEGGPSDIVGRVGLVPSGTDVATTPSAGWRAEDLYPAVVGSADPEVALGNMPGLNFSSTNLDDASTDNPYDDSRAHRAILEGDFIVIGYSYTPDQAVARYTDLENYNFYLRRSSDGGQTWETARNVSNITDTSINVKEPRLVETPATVSGSADPRDTKNSNVFFVGWGTELNQYEAVAERNIDLDIYLTRTTDGGDSYETATNIAPTDLAMTINNAESQLRPTPDGSEVYVVWMHFTPSGGEVQFASGIAETYSTKSSSTNFFGCSVNPRAGFDPSLPLVVMVSLLFLAWRRRLQGAGSRQTGASA